MRKKWSHAVQELLRLIFLLLKWWSDILNILFSPHCWSEAQKYYWSDWVLSDVSFGQRTDFFAPKTITPSCYVCGSHSSYSNTRSEGLIINLIINFIRFFFLCSGREGGILRGGKNKKCNHENWKSLSCKTYMLRQRGDSQDMKQG